MIYSGEDVYLGRAVAVVRSTRRTDGETDTTYCRWPHWHQILSWNSDLDRMADEYRLVYDISAEFEPPRRLPAPVPSFGYGI